MFLTKPIREKASRPFDEVIAALDGAGMQTASGAYVNSGKAMRQATVWACVRILSEIIAQLPIEVQRKEKGRWVTSEMHDALELLATPNDWMTQHDFLSHLVHWSELVGNGFYYKNTNSRGKILRLLPINGDDCHVSMSSDWRLEYSVASSDGINGDFGRDKIFHMRNFGSNGYSGLSTIGNLREGIGLALRLEEFGASQFKNGLSARTWLENTGTGSLSDAQKKELREELKKYEGADNAGKTMLLGGGLKLNTIDTISAADAQYLESRRFQKQDIASIFGVPLFLLNDTEKSTTWGTGLEQLSRSFVRFSLKPRLNRCALTLNRELISEKERLNTRFIFDTDEFTLGEFKERMEGYRSAIESGVLNPNECREIEGRNPREGGDDYRQPMNIDTEGQQNED